MDLEDQADQAHSIRVPLVQRPETSFRWCFEFLSCHVLRLLNLKSDPVKSTQIFSCCLPDFFSDSKV